MISVVIPYFGAESTIGAQLDALRTAAETRITMAEL